MAPFSPRRSLLVPVLGAAGAAGLVLSRLSPFSDAGVAADRSVGAMLCELVAVGLLVSVSQLLARFGGASEEDRAWRPILVGVALLAGSVLLTQGLELLDDLGFGPRAGVRDLVFSAGCLVACAPIYRGLVHWNRIRTGSTDPGEMLNGFGAVCVAASIGNLLLPQWSHSLPGLAQWRLQAAIGTCAAIVILLGTAMTVAAVGGLLRNPRIWLVTVAIGVVASGQVPALLAREAPGAPSAPLWLFMATMITSCALIAPGTGLDQTLDHTATVVGALVVLLGGVTVVLVNGAFFDDQRRLASCFAATGLLVASLGLVRVVQDLADLSRIRREALTDDLTGLPNRRAVLSAIEDALLSGQPFSLLILDLERFKTINDRYGHATGDLLLRHLAATLATDIPNGALLARLGGDEFAVLLEADTTQALALANAFVQEDIPLVDRHGGLIQVRINIGVATTDPATTDGGELLRRADTALDQAKASGSGVCGYDRALDVAKQDRLALIEDLHLALDGHPPQDDQIVVYFQPQLRASTGVVVGAEALARWAHPRLGLLTPDTFVDLAQQNGLMPSLTARVMRQATTEATVWRAAGHHLRISVNLSAACLNDPALLPLIDEVLEQGLAAADLVLEVTETSLMSDPDQSLAALRRLAQRGVGVSIDDYGTGYSSLSYLNDLPATELKIDRSFTSRIVSDPRTAAIVAGTVELAHRLGIRIVAEGVEDEATLTAMRELGCDETQGYLHSRPLPATAFLQWLHARQPVPSEQSSSPLATRT